MHMEASMAILRPKRDHSSGDKNKTHSYVLYTSNT